jgi:hypothetical protein
VLTFTNPQNGGKMTVMSVVELETAVESLSAQDFREFMDWLDIYREKVWDRQIASDLKSGRLDAFLTEARESNKNKITLPLVKKPT